jgi:uncharacterized membrane-anchored protein YhcB (DUF1043 family)
MVLTTRHGQFFIIGALLIAALITGYVVLDVGSLQTPQTQTPRQLFDHTLSEFPAAINQITAADRGAELLQQRLTAYLAFQRHLSASHGTSTQMHALATVPEADNVTVVVANFHGQDAADIRVTVDGTTETTSTLADASAQLFTFDNVPRSMDVRLAFNAGQSFNQSFQASSNRRTALFHVRTQGQNQVWTDTRIY